MASVDEMPRPYDKIYVKYEVDDDRHVWWPATVLRTKEYKNPSTIVGTGTLQFAALNGMKASTEDVVFLEGGIVHCNDGETPWRSTAEAADAGQADVDEAEWKTKSQKKSSRKKKSESEMHGRAIANNNTQRTLVFPATKTEGDVDVERPALVETSPPQGRSRRKSTPTRKVAIAKSDATNEWHTGSPAMDNLYRRVAGLEQKASAECDHKELRREFVDERIAILKTRMVEFLGRSPKGNGSKKCSPFHSILQSTSLNVSELAAYNTFRMLVEDVSKCAELGCSIEFIPSLAGILNPVRGVHSATIVFTKASALMHWLGVRDASDVRALVVRDTATVLSHYPYDPNHHPNHRGSDMIRIVGGLTRGGEFRNDVRLFPGRSAFRTEQEAIADVRSIHFDGGSWDDSNGMFATPPSLVPDVKGLKTTSDRCFEGCFTLSWECKTGQTGRVLTRSGRWLGGVQLGTLQLHIPYTTIVGIATCKRVRSLLSCMDFDTM